MPLFDDQVELYENARNVIRHGHKRILVRAETGSGKCLGIDTPVLMYDGTIKPVQNVVANDLLIGPDSKPRKVVSTCTGREEMFRVTPINGGEPFECNGSHILSLRQTGITNHPKHPSDFIPKGNIVNLSVYDYLGRHKTFKHEHKLYRPDIIEFPKNKKKLSLSPYFVGAWLGDGTTTQSAITSMDDEVIQAVYTEATKFGLFVRKTRAGGKSNTYCITTNMPNGYYNQGKNSVRHALIELGLLNNIKHIPHIYKTASRAERLELLAGLIDTDGSLSSNCFDYISKSEQLAKDVAFLSRSLGLRANLRSCRKKCYNNGVTNTYWRVGISGDTDIVPCRIARKRATPREINKNPTSTGFKIESLGAGDYYGFEIEGPDRLFLLGDFTVTHNTHIATHLIHNANTKGNVCAFVVPRKELLHQTALTFQAFGINNYSYVAAGKHYFSPNSQNYLCTMQTLCNRLGDIQPNIVIIDEAHFGAAQMDRIIQHYSDAGAYVIGLSATPEKTNGKPMGDWYDVMVEGKDLRWLIDNQRLSDYRLFVPHTISVDGLRIVNGDYSKSQADALIEADRAVVGSVVDFYKKYAMGKRHMTFAQNIKKSKELAEAYNAAGVPSAHMDGDTPDGERKRIINAYADGGYLNICSVDLLFFGFDLSAQVGRDVPVESMSDVRLTGSRIVQRQKTGRVLRYKPYPALIFDHVGNALPERHGLPCAPQEWSLHGRVKRKKAKSESDGMRQCMKCFYVHYTAPVCPNCGSVYPKKTPAEIEQLDGELVEIQRQQERKAKRIEESMCHTLEDWVALAEERGYKKAWAYKRYELRKGKS